MNGTFVVRGGTSLPANRDGEPPSSGPTRLEALRRNGEPCPAVGHTRASWRARGGSAAYWQPHASCTHTRCTRPAATAPARRPVAAPARRPVAAPARRPAATPAATWPPRQPIPAVASQSPDTLAWAQAHAAAIRKAKARQWFAPAPGTY